MVLTNCSVRKGHIYVSVGDDIGKEMPETITVGLYGSAVGKEYAPLRTCHAVTEVLDSVDTGIGYIDRLIDNCSECGEPLTADYSQNTPERAVLQNYCPRCGAKVISGATFKYAKVVDYE